MRMIARGKHIPSINETYAIQKSDGTQLYDTSAPYNAGAPVDMNELNAAMMDTFKADIDAAMAKQQEGK